MERQSDSSSLVCIKETTLVIRINKIHKLDCQWNYVPTNSKTAELQTRGILAEQLEQSTLWWNGPTWITKEDHWLTLTPIVKPVVSIMTTTHNDEQRTTIAELDTGTSKIINLA